MELICKSYSILLKIEIKFIINYNLDIFLMKLSETFYKSTLIWVLCTFHGHIININKIIIRIYP